MSSAYISQIGLATENTAKLALFQMLEVEYRNVPGFTGEMPQALAGAVTDLVFGEEPQGSEEKVAFAKSNPELIKTHAQNLAKREDLCSVLTGAAYNTCYGRYVRAGGKRTMFSNPFLAYVRSGRDLRSRSNREINVQLYSEISALDRNIFRAMDAMESLGILRSLPHSPNERAFYDAVRQFAVSVGVRV